MLCCSTARPNQTTQEKMTICGDVPDCTAESSRSYVSNYESYDRTIEGQSGIRYRLIVSSILVSSLCTSKYIKVISRTALFLIDDRTKVSTPSRLNPPLPLGPFFGGGKVSTPSSLASRPIPKRPVTTHPVSLISSSLNPSAKSLRL